GKNLFMQIGQTLGGTAPTFGISSILGPAFVPFYTVPMTLLGLFFTPVNSWSSNMQNAYGEAWAAGAIDWIRDAFRKTVERTLVFGGLGVALFLSFGNTFIQFWTHDRLRLVPWMALSVSSIVVISTLVKAAEYLLVGLNRQRHAAMAEVASGILAMVLVPLSLRWFGLGAVGAGAIAAVLGTSSWVLLGEIRTRLGRGSFPSINYVLKAGIAFAATAALGRLMADLTWAPGFGATVWRLLFGGAICSAVFVFAALGLRLIPLTELLAGVSWIRKRLAVTPQ